MAHAAKPPPAEKELPKYASSAEVASATGHSVKFVRANAAQLGGTKVGNRWLFPVGALPGGPRVAERS